MKPKSNNSTISYSPFLNTKRKDKSYLKYDTYSKNSYIKDNYQKLHFKKIPYILKDKIQLKTNINSDSRSTKPIDDLISGSITAFVFADIVDFTSKLIAIKSINIYSFFPPIPHMPTNMPSQRRKSIDAKVRGKRGEDTSNSYIRQCKLAPLYNIMNAFIAGPIQLYDIQLADTAINIHIVNNLKQFIEFYILNANINTADNSTTLQV